MLMAFFGCISATAERVAPTLPDFVQLESGKNYYLYNVGTGKFLTYNSGVKVAEAGKSTTITSSGSYYTILFSGTDYYLYSSSNTSITRSTSNGNYAKFSFNSIDNQSYTIQRYNSKDTMFVGCSTDATDLAIYPELSDDNNIEWKLIDGEKGDMYCARLRLYNALEAMSGTTYNIDKFEAIYADEASTVDAINNAATILSDGLSLSSNYVFPASNDFPILFERSTDYNWQLSSKGCFSIESYEGGTLTATVVVDGDATLHYDLRCSNYTANSGPLKIVIDGNEIQWSGYNVEIGTKRFFYELKAGKHIIEWVCSDESVYSKYIERIAVERTPTVTVNLLEPGSLGTEILYNVNHLKDVRKLVINGNMNSDDWDKIDMMSGNLYTLDISGTDVKTITERCFFDWPYLHAIKLPEGLTTIEENAFYSSPIGNMNFPSSLQYIGTRALAYTNICEAILPEGCTNIGTGVFDGCFFLKKAKISDSIRTIPDHFFYGCENLTSFDFPSGLFAVGAAAFEDCFRYLIPKFPETLEIINSYAFFACEDTDSLIIPKETYYIGDYAFYNTGYKYVELPVAYYKINGPFLPSTIKTIRLNCPTVVLDDYESIGVELSNVTLQVPSHLVNSYKLDDYWYNAATIDGFDTDEIDYWQIQRELVLNARDRLKGTPSIEILAGGSLKINGNDGMPINDLTLCGYKNSYKYGQIFSNADGVTVNGNLSIDYYLGTANKWYYISLPFDVKVCDIISTDITAKRAIRYYDGARRAEQGASGNWINANEDDIIPAGTGFIMQSNIASLWRFPSQENESKQYMTSYKMFAKALQANVSENASDKGWNLVGNPYQCYYNIHKLNFTAPITVRNVSKNTYEAYSVIDDDYAIEPNEAFFVQCPDGVTEISFPLDGRQLSSVIEDANASKPHGAQERSSRFLMDITVSNGKISDRTRIVLNDKATMDYEMNCDASKFMSESAEVPQIFSHDGANTMYAINERPEADGKVLLGFTTMENGVFSISLTRNNVENVFLVDNEMGQTVDLNAGSYEFTAEAGNYMNRFELRLNSTPTGIEEIANSSDATTFRVVEGGIVVNGYAEVFNMAGQKVAEGSGTLPMANGTYVLKTNGKSVKVIVK